MKRKKKNKNPIIIQYVIKRIINTERSDTKNKKKKIKRRKNYKLGKKDVNIQREIVCAAQV